MNENYIITVTDQGDSCHTVLNGSGENLLNAFSSIASGMIQAFARIGGLPIASQVLLEAYERGVAEGAEKVGED